MQVNTHGSYDSILLSNALTLSLELLDQILANITFAHALSTFDEENRNNTVSFLSSDIKLFVEITTLISKALLSSRINLLVKAKESHIQLLFILKGIVQVNQKQDLIALEELIKYELRDNLTQWKIDLIPQAKKLLLV